MATATILDTDRTADAVRAMPAPAATPSQRLFSLDALRGFDMFWIIGGDALVDALAKVTHWPPMDWLAGQMSHAGWAGFTLIDLVFPMFLFMAGVATPYSLARRQAAGHSQARLHWHAIRRGLTLVLLGMVFNGLLRKLSFHDARYLSVLGLIGMGYMFACLISMHWSWRGQVGWVIVLLIGYWAIMRFVPVPIGGMGDYRKGHNVADYIDRKLVPGTLYNGNHDPEGPLHYIPAAADALLGVLAGQWIMRSTRRGHTKAVALLLAGAACFGLGWLWNPWFPVCKHLWTSSFVLVAGGLSLMLLALFYWVTDVCMLRRWAWPLTVIGMNSITIYLMLAFVDFEKMSSFFFDGIARLSGSYQPVVLAVGVLIVEWLLLWFLYRKRVFLAV